MLALTIEGLVDVQLICDVPASKVKLLATDSPTVELVPKLIADELLSVKVLLPSFIVLEL